MTPKVITAEVANANFKFYLSGLGYHNYVGFETFKDVVGFALAKRLVRDAFSKGLDTYTRHLRRGLKIEIYGK